MAQSKDKKNKKITLSSGSTPTEIAKILNKKFGAEAVRIMSDTPTGDIPVFSTGSLKVDHALGIGGLPRGRIVEIMGPEASGKTTIALHTMAAATKAGGLGLFIDAENALDLDLVKKMGVNLDSMIINQPACAEEGLDIVETGVSTSAFDVIVIDSVSALTPRAEIEGEMGDSHMGLQARLMGQAMRKLTKAVAASNTLIIFINQIRMKIGVMFGSPETTSGGQALKFFSSIRLDIRPIGKIKTKEKIIGNRVKVTPIKNKLAPPFRKVETDLLFGRGFVRELELLDMACEYDVIDRHGPQYNYEGSSLGKGRSAASKALLHDPVLFETILSEVRKHTTELGVENGDDEEEV